MSLGVAVELDVNDFSSLYAGHRARFGTTMKKWSSF
jgi:hypothetical protein